MPAGQVVGRISVRVLPDTSEFKDKAKRELERIEQQLKVTIGTKIDTSGARRGVLEAVRDINRDNRSTDSRKIRFYTTISTHGMRTAVEKAARELQAKANDRKIAFEVDEVRGAGKVALVLDEESTEKTKKDIEDWVKHVSPVQVDVELNFPTGATTAVNARLAYLSRPRTVQILPTLNEAAVAKVATALAALSGARVLNNIFEKLGRTLKNLDKNVPVIGSLALAISGLAGWSLSAASNLAALSASLAQIGYTALLLPGLLGGMAVGLGVTIAAFKDFNKVIPEVKTALSGLQDTISTNFWAKAEEPIRKMVDDLLPRFTAGVNDTATALGGFFGRLATNLGTSLSPALGQMFEDLSKSIANATQGTDTFASIIATLGQVGTSYLPALADWFVTVSEKFDAFLNRKGEAGLKAEIDEGIQSLKDLGSVLQHTGGILAGIARAAEAAGGSSLGMMADTLERIHGVVDSPGFQSGLTDVFRAAHEAMNQIATISGPAVKQFFTELGQLLTEVLPQVGTIIGTALDAVASALAQPAVTEGVKAMFDGIQTAVTALAPAMAPLGEALGALMQVIGAFAAMLGPLVTAALVPLAQAFSALAPAVIPIIELLGGALTSALQQLAPILAPLVPVIGEALGAAFSALSVILPPVAELFTTIMAAVAPLAAQLIEGLAPILPVLAEFLAGVVTAAMPLVEILLKLLEAVIVPLIPVVQEVAAAVLPALQAAFAHLVEAVQPLLEALLAVVDFLMPILAPAIEFIATLLGESLAAAIDGVALIFEGAIGLIKSVWDIFAGIFTGDWSRVWDGIKGVFTGIWDLIVGAFKVFLNIGILGVAGKILKGVKSLWTTIWNGIKSFATGLWNAIRGAAGVFMTAVRGYIDDGLNFIKGLWNRVWGGIKSFFSDTWDTVKRLASEGMDKLKTAVSDGISKAVQFIKDLPGKAKEGLGDLGSTLLSAGKKLIQGFIDGVKNMFSSVKNTLGDLTDKLTSWKGPPARDATLLTDAGQLVIDSFIKGLESRYDAVRDSLRGLTREVAGTEFEPPGVGQVRGAVGASRQVTGSLAASTGGTGVTKILNYYAAPGSSLASDEELFAATSRARAGW
ncbi:phage tail protein [Streptomyces variabilis]